MIDPADIAPYKSLRYRILILLLGISLLAAVSMAFIAVYVTRLAGVNAHQVSSQALEDQVEDYLIQLNDSSAREKDLLLQDVLRDAQEMAGMTAAIFNNPQAYRNQIPWQADEYIQFGSEGQYANDPQDITSVFVPNTAKIDDATIRDIELSSYLEPIFQNTLDNNPILEAIYFATPHEVVRYYPNVNLGEILPPDFQATGRIWYEGSLADNNPTREPWWTPPYVDATGLGLVTTAAVPVYGQSGNMIGVIGLDITLNGIIAAIEETRLLDSGYSFLIDDLGHAIALPEQGYHDLLGQQPTESNFYPELSEVDQSFAPILTKMMAGGRGFGRLMLGKQEKFIAYAPLESTGWSLGSVVTAEEALKGLTPLRVRLEWTTRSLFLTLILPVSLAVFALVILIGLFTTKRITDPIQKLVSAVQKIGAGNWDIEFPQSCEDEIGLLAREFSSMAGQLQELILTLEQRVGDRTRQLERSSLQIRLAAEIARDTTSIHDLDELLANSVNLIRGRFGFYHTGIFLVDENGEFAILRAATDEAGREMIARGHKLKIEKSGYSQDPNVPVGLVGIATGTGQPRMALNVGGDSEHYKNPLLPETRSEMVLPLITNEKVIGALDVQSQHTNAFDEEDITILRIVADQLAVAIENARLLQEIQFNLKELETIYRQYAQVEWSKLAHNNTVIGYEYHDNQLVPISPSVSESHQVEGVSTSDVCIPLEVRGVQIGNLKIWADQGQLAPNQVALIEKIATRLSDAMESARLYQDTQRRAERERLSGLINTKLRASNDPRMILEIAARELGQVLGVDKTQITLQPRPGKTKDASHGGNGHTPENL